MTAVKDIARITRDGQDIRDDLPTNAWMIWTRARELAGDDAEHQTRYGVDGVLWEGSVSSIIAFLWPTLPDNRDDPEALNTRRALGRYLKDSRNMLCVHRGGPHTASRWWVRNEWTDAPPAGKSGAPYVGNVTERRLTAVESGETRDPAPVHVRYKCRVPGCEHVADSQRALDQHRRYNHPAQPDADGKYPCGIDRCRFRADTNYSLGQHRRHHHPGWRKRKAANPAPAEQPAAVEQPAAADTVPAEAPPALTVVDTTPADAVANDPVDAIVAVVKRNQILEQENAELRRQLDAIRQTVNGGGRK